MAPQKGEYQMTTLKAARSHRKTSTTDIATSVGEFPSAHLPSFKVVIWYSPFCRHDELQATFGATSTVAALDPIPDIGYCSNFSPARCSDVPPPAVRG